MLPRMKPSLQVQLRDAVFTLEISRTRPLRGIWENFSPVSPCNPPHPFIDPISLLTSGFSETTSIPTNPRTTRPVGYAFVDLSTADDAQRAIGELSGKEVLDRKVSVQLARKPESAAERAEAAASGGEGVSGGEGGKRRNSGRGRGYGRGRGRGGRAGRGGRSVCPYTPPFLLSANSNFFIASEQCRRPNQRSRKLRAAQWHHQRERNGRARTWSLHWCWQWGDSRQSERRRRAQ